MDAKTKDDAEELENMNQLASKNVITSWDLHINATRATVLVREGEFNTVDEIESCLLEQCKAQGLPVSSVKRFTRKSRKSGKCLQIASLTFESRVLPE